MVVEFYNNSSDDKVVNKTITLVTEIDGTLKDNVNVFNPVLRLNKKIPMEVNYCYVPAFNRYYFINNINMDITNNVIITLTCDVLMTFKDEIYTSVGHFIKQENYNKYYADFPVLPTKNVRVFKFNKMFRNTPTLLLITAKGERTVN